MVDGAVPPGSLAAYRTGSVGWAVSHVARLISDTTPTGVRCPLESRRAATMPVPVPLARVPKYTQELPHEPLANARSSSSSPAYAERTANAQDSHINFIRRRNIEMSSHADFESAADNGMGSARRRN